MIKPTIHLNGTSAQSLANQYGHARQKVREALEALQHIETHGRDYYVQGPDAYHIAAKQQIALSVRNAHNGNLPRLPRQTQMSDDGTVFL